MESAIQSTEVSANRTPVRLHTCRWGPALLPNCDQSRSARSACEGSRTRLCHFTQRASRPGVRQMRRHTRNNWSTKGLAASAALQRPCLASHLPLGRQQDAGIYASLFRSRTQGQFSIGRALENPAQWAFNSRILDYRGSCASIIDAAVVKWSRGGELALLLGNWG